MPNVSDNREFNGGFIKALGRSRAANAATVLPASMFSNYRLPAGRAAGIELTYSASKTLYVALVQHSPARGFPFAPSNPRFLVGEALLFGPLKRVFLNQEALSLIPLSSATPFQY